MKRNVIAVAVFITASVFVARISNSQQADGDESRPATLGQRLNQFRQDLFGGDEEETPPAPRRSSTSTAPSDPWASNPKFPRPAPARSSGSEIMRDRPSDVSPKATAKQPARQSQAPPQPSSQPRTAASTPQAMPRPASARREPPPAAQPKSAVTSAPFAPNEPHLARPSTAPPSESEFKPARRAQPTPGANPLVSRPKATVPSARASEPVKIEPLEIPETAEASSGEGTSASRREPQSLQERISAARDDDSDKHRPTPAEPAPHASRLEPELPGAVSRGIDAPPAELDSEERNSADSISNRSSSPPSGGLTGSRSPERSSAVGEALLFTGKSPQLIIEASGPQKVVVGREAEFVVRVRNIGEVTANNVLVTVKIPSFVEVISNQATAGATQAPAGVEHTEPLEWRLQRLEPRATENVTLRLVPRKSVPLDLAAQWSCSPESSQTLVEVQEPKLLMAISGPEEVLFGQTKIYKLTLSNPGNGDAENVMVSLLPIGRTSDGMVSHRIGHLRAGESKVIEVELTARQAGAMTIKAQSFGDGGLRAESAQQVLVRRAALQVEVTGAKVKYAGTSGTYHVKVANTGNAPAERVQVSVVLPPDAKFTSSTGGGRVEGDRSRVNWNVGTLPPNVEREFDVQCSLQSAGENRVQAMALAEGDLNSTATATTRVEALADLKLEVRDPQGPIAVGDDAVYEVAVKNRGTKSAEEVDLMVFFSDGLEAVTVQGGPNQIGHGQVVFKTIASLAANSETVYRVHARAERPGNHVFRAEVVCHPLRTKLATEETTHFYGDEPPGAELTPAQGDARPLAPAHYEPAGRFEPERPLPVERSGAAE